MMHMFCGSVVSRAPWLSVSTANSLGSSKSSVIVIDPNTFALFTVVESRRCRPDPLGPPPPARPFSSATGTRARGSLLYEMLERAYDAMSYFRTSEEEALPVSMTVSRRRV